MSKLIVYGICKRHRNRLTVFGSDGVREYMTHSTAKAVRKYIYEASVRNQELKGREIARKILERGVGNA